MFLSRILALSTGAIVGISVGSTVGALILIMLLLIPIKKYFTAIFSGCYVSAFKLISLRLRKVSIQPILDAYILAKKSKLKISFKGLEVHHLAGGACNEVIQALLTAKKAGLDLSFDEACAIDLSSHQVVQAVESFINPKVIEVKVKGACRDNIELEVTAKITLKGRKEDFVGHISDDTLASKVSKYILAKILSVNNHKTATPYNLVKDIKTSGLDSGNAYQLISCDITSIEIAGNLNNEIFNQKLEQLKTQAQIEMERQKTAAEIETERAKLKIEEGKNAVLEAEAEVPKAIAEAIRDGRLSVMDYYKLMNLQADTAMRRSMSGDDNLGDNGQ